MALESNIELAYEFLASRKMPVKLPDIWKAISTKTISNKDSLDMMADLYSDMVIDNRFALTSKGQWSLTGKCEDVKKELYMFEDDKLSRLKKIRLIDEEGDELDDEDIDSTIVDIDEDEEDYEDQEDESIINFYDFDEE